VQANGAPVKVTLYPPVGPRKAWYAYWPGQSYSRSTGQSRLNDAVAVVDAMVRNGGRPPELAATELSDREFEEIQRQHFRRNQDGAAAARAQKSLTVCLEAIHAFQKITAVSPISFASPDDCARFQRAAIQLPKNWRQTYPKGKKSPVPKLSANTVLKWSRSLQAAFQRANRGAGKKCVRGVVDGSKLLASNPWHHFTWIDGAVRQKRHFSAEELLSVLDYFEHRWPGIHSLAAAVKTALWTWSRVAELASLSWDESRIVGKESHFEIVGKWGVEKWARIPDGLFDDLRQMRTSDRFVFAAYNDELRSFYLNRGQSRFAEKVGAVYSPTAFASWFQATISEWAMEMGVPGATPHIFRKTALQHARRGEDLNRQVAQDAKLNVSVMLSHYVEEHADQLRHASNRTYQRILASLPVDVAVRYGHSPANEEADLEKRLLMAAGTKDWTTVADLADKLQRDTN
jgi:integrase